jgi:hypothetical protein
VPDSSPSWWAALKHGGLLIAPSRLVEAFPDPSPALSPHLAERLRRDLVRLEAGASDAESILLDTVLERVCGLGDTTESRWRRGSDVPRDWSFRTLTGETVRPRRLWEGPHGALLPVFVDGEGRLGVGRGRHAVSRVVEWLRGKQQPVALLTNGHQWRLIHAGLDYEAWAEWDTDLWFEEGRPGPQVDALQALLSPRALTPPRPNETAPLLAAIFDSRRGQAELSAVLGERVRQAVELLIQSHGPALEALVSGASREMYRDTYRAAARVVMRMIVVLFAEARGLLPRDNPIYHGSYGLEGLRETLDRVGTGAGPERLRQRWGAWPRVLALFRLVFEGSHHPDLPVPRYGGGLFEPGAPDASDPVSKALAVFEDSRHAPSDFHVRATIELLTRTRVRVRQGAGSTWIEAPVDFSDLSSEYIGVLYEGLLDYELRRAGPDDPYVVLALGDEPTLPLLRLEAMEDEALKNLVAKARQRRGPAVATEEEGDDSEEDEQETDEADEDEPRELASTMEDVSGGDERQRVRERAHAWAVRAVTVARLVARSSSKKAEVQAAYEAAVAQAARDLVPRTIVPGEWFLVRWGGTRKGAGTFYTRPQLAVPTVHRALRPLAYDAPGAPDGTRDEEASPALWTPRSPEDILRLKVCDPAMGSASFLVASLRFLTTGLYASLFHHGWLARQNGHLAVVRGEGRPPWFLEAVRDMPLEAEEAERYLHARLRRHVVERCLYGVDIDPLAVELGRLALWIETMDWVLPFGFLDHKIKVGNALVGCWFDQFQDYPVLAWEREGGDKGHGRGVQHEEGAWTRAIKEFYPQRVAPAVVSWLDRQGVLFEPFEGRDSDQLHAEAVALFETLHALPIHDPDARAAFYRDSILRSPALARLKEAFDTWCATWFWPAPELESAPLPLTFAQPSDTTRAVLGRLAGEHRFFHWELEFPDVFAAPGSGFDAVLGNPPWEIQKPNSREFFSNIDPLYRTYGKQEALRRQEEYFTETEETERAWIEYGARLKALSNWSALARAPWGDPADESTPSFNPFKGKGSKVKAAQFHDKWRRARVQRRAYADPEHPYRHQGSADLNTYKMFLEQAHALLRPGGTLAMIAPSGLYTDKGSTDLRTLFLERCRWRWLFGFENREKVFDIDSRFKFGPVIVQKGGSTEAIRTAFMRRHLRDWTEAERHVIPYRRAQVTRFSPRTRAILEIRGRRDLEILEKIYANSVLLGDQGPDGWGIRYATEFHMTNDSALFPPRPKWEADGYRPDEYGRWLKFRRKEPNLNRAREAGWIRLADGSGVVHEDDIEDIALPLYEGRMIGQFDFSEKGWVSGKGRGALWREIPWERKCFEPQYLMKNDAFLRASEEAPEGSGALRGLKVGFMAIGSATNERSMFCACIYDRPCGNAVPVLKASVVPDSELPLTAILNSFVYDYALRARLGGINLNYFVIEETPLPVPNRLARQTATMKASASLGWAHVSFAPEWLQMGGQPAAGQYARRSWRRRWAVTAAERVRCRCILDAIQAEMYGLEWDDLAWILRECDYPVESLSEKPFARILDPKGFWRVDKEKDPETRHTVLTLAAFRDLKAIISARGGDRERGIESFFAQNESDGWMLPEMLCLDDLGLGHDERAKRPQAVRERVGERFYPWQLEQSVEESWAECERHARNLLGPEGYARLEAELRGEPVEVREPAMLKVAEKGPTPYGSGTPGAQVRLFPGEPTLFGDVAEDPPPTRRKQRRR